MSIIYGTNQIKECILSGQKKRQIEEVLFIKDKPANDKLIELLKKNAVKFSFADKKMFKQNYQGVLAKTSDYAYADESVLKNKTRIFVLNKITDDRNFGAIIRSAVAFNIDALVISKDNSVSVNEVVCRASSGMDNHIDIAMVTNTSRLLKSLKGDGFWVYGLDANGEDINNVKIDKKSVFVLGSEGTGISKLVKEQLDFTIKIPINEKVDSLNVSVAAAIVMSRIDVN